MNKCVDSIIYWIKRRIYRHRRKAYYLHFIIFSASKSIKISLEQNYVYTIKARFKIQNVDAGFHIASFIISIVLISTKPIVQ